MLIHKIIELMIEKELKFEVSELFDGKGIILYRRNETITFAQHKGTHYQCEILSSDCSAVSRLCDKDFELLKILL